MNKTNKASIYKNRKEESFKSVAQPTVYRKGQKPEWVDDDEDEDIFSNCSEEEINSNTDKLKEETLNKNAEDNFPKEVSASDRRLERLNKEHTQYKDKEDIIEQRLKLRREVYKSEVVSSQPLNENKSEITGVTTGSTTKVELIDFSKRRELMKNAVSSNNNILSNKQENLDEDELLSLIGDEDNSDNGKNSPYSKNKEEEDNLEFENNNNEDASSDSDTSFQEEDEFLFRPVFVSKEARLTLDEENEEVIQKEIFEEKEKLKSLRKKQTKEIVKKLLEEEKESVKDTEVSTENLPDDTDDLDNIEEYERWKLRELRRIKVQFEESERKLKERLEIERRRNLSDEQRKEENLRLGSDDTLRPFRSKLNFLQKFYHKGVYFQEKAENLDHIYNRDYNLPTWEDKVDRSTLPKILQVRRGLQFKKGRTKYTHLSAEDTTNFDPNFKVPEFIASKFTSSTGGYKAQNDFDLGRKRK